MSEEGTPSDLPPLTPEEIRLNLGRLCRMQQEILKLVIELENGTLGIVNSETFKVRGADLRKRLEALDKLILPPLA